MSKREARIARDADKRLRELEKSARLRERVPDSGVRVGEQISANKAVRTGADPGSIFSMGMTWSCEAPDWVDAWSWGTKRKWDDADWEGVILPKLKEWEALTWGEIDAHASGSGHKMHHNMDTDVICDEAQLRLIELERYGDTIFRFRLGNKRRLWGFRTLATFEIVWFDPTHQIYPTEPA